VKFLANWYWKARYRFYRVSGIMRRALLLSRPGRESLGETMSRLEADPEMREHLERARIKLKQKRHTW
jgi:hypothetical protein